MNKILQRLERTSWGRATVQIALFVVIIAALAGSIVIEGRKHHKIEDGM